MTARSSTRVRSVHRRWHFAAAVAPLALAHAVAAQPTPQWVAAKSPEIFAHNAMAYDAARGRIVAFGGAASAQTWEWEGSAWTLRAPASSPGPRVGHALCYDPVRQRTVLFGGTSPAQQFLADTWEWDGDTWTQRAPAVAPSPRTGHGMAFDHTRRRAVLFGGNVAGGPGNHYADTWEWDGNAWQQRSPATTPPARTQHAMAFDLLRKRVVMLGGRVNGNPLTPTLWEWDGNDWTERRLLIGPRARWSHSLGYDVVRDRIVLFGGRDGGVFYADVWEWNGAQWSLRGPSTSPPARAEHAIAYDSTRRQMVLFGGYSGAGFHTDTWAWDGTNWTKLVQASAPGVREYAPLVTDLARGRIVLFGGVTHGRTDVRGDTWEWDGVRWLARSPATSPPARARHALAFDLARQRIVLFGGSDVSTRLADTWEWDGNTWTQRFPATSPPAMTHHAMTYDVARQRVVLFGGIGVGGMRNDTWEYDGVNWVVRRPANNPTPRTDHALAYDFARNRVVMFGGADGTSALAETWEWDGTNWMLRNPATSPPPRAQHSMTFDLFRGRIVVFGGGNAGAYSNDVWEWDGSSWSARPSGPALLGYHGLAVDPVRGGLFLYGASYGVAGGPYLWHEVPRGGAGVQPIGTSCASAGNRTLLTSSAPYLGHPGFSLELVEARASSPCLFGLSAATQTLPIGPCTLYVQDPILPFHASTNAAGFAQSPSIAVPFDVTLRGATVYAQAFVADPQAPVLGIAFSAGRRLVFGD